MIGASIEEVAKTTKTKRSGLKVVGLFAGIGGMELGLAKAGHRTDLRVEIDAAANAVLRERFPDTPKAVDVRNVKSLPGGIDVIAAGFPCQNLSQAGQTEGIHGSKSGLVGEVFRLAKKSRAPWILLENVPFMLQLNRGEAIRHIVDELESLGYAWAYRKIDTRAFGLPQRRERVFLLASSVADPARLLFQQAVEPQIPVDHQGLACGFYWTEGTRGLGWAIDAIPTLKGGSTIGIASPPAIWMPDGRICTPDLRDGERLQGFEADWTQPAETVGRGSYRWKLAGNAISVPAAEWAGSVLNLAEEDPPPFSTPLSAKGSWPDAAFGRKGSRREMRTTTWPEARRYEHLQDFLKNPAKDLSGKATLGFYRRLTGGTLRHPAEFRAALEHHLGFSSKGNPVSATEPTQMPLFAG